MSAEQIRADGVAIYIRWSTEDQGEGTTLDVQLDSCKAYILSQGWAFRDDLVFVDDGVSGATMERPALRRLREKISQRLVDCVVVYKLDRLSRSMLDVVKLVLEEWDGLCSIKSAREPIDTITPTGRMFFYQLMSFAEWERAVIRDRMTSGRIRRAQEGRHPGASLPYGYRKTTGKQIEQHPEQAPVVSRIFRLYLSGIGCRTISKTLDTEGFPGPGGGKWGEPTLGRILANPAYMGRFIYGKQKVKGKRKVSSDTPLVIKDGFFPAIVTEQEFEAVQRLRAERPGVRRNQGSGRSLGSQILLTGLLKCTCGRSCVGVGQVRRGISYRYYICGGAQATGSHVCNAGNIRQDLLDNLVVRKLLTLFRGSDARERLVGHLTRDIQIRFEETATARQAAEREAHRLEESERRIKGLFIDGKLSLEEYRQLQAELNAKLAEARSTFQVAAESEESAKAALGHHRLNTVLLDRINEWETLSLPEQKQLLRQFISHIVTHRDKATSEVRFEIAWRWASAVGDETAEVLVQERSTERMKTAAQKRRRLNGRFVAGLV